MPLAEVIPIARKRTRSSLLTASLLLTAAAGLHAPAAAPAKCAQADGCAAHSPLVERIYLLQQGARPRWSPDGRWLVFDRVNQDGYFDLYRMNVATRSVLPITDGAAGIGARNHGNGVHHPSGKAVVFISEVERHYRDRAAWMANPGLGLFSNLWIWSTINGVFTQLTDIPVKHRLLDGKPAIATVNPMFSPDGRQLVWTERYAKGGNHNWGRWRLKIADFGLDDGAATLTNPRVLYTPQRGNYVTAMGYLEPNVLLVAGNLDGQHEYGMDHYRLALEGGDLRNVLPSPKSWEEGACIAPDSSYVFMSNRNSRLALDFDDPDWARQPIERDYYRMPAGGGEPQQLTFFHESDAPEHLGIPVHVAACSISPDGRWIAATLGLDFGDADSARLQLHLGLILLARPLR